MTEAPVDWHVTAVHAGELHAGVLLLPAVGDFDAARYGLLFSRFSELFRDLQRAPAYLAVARRILYWSVALIDSAKCREHTRRGALAAVTVAVELYRNARARVLRASRPGPRAAHRDR